MQELSKFFKSESVELMRSEIQIADYNPRQINDDAKKKLKRGIKKFGLVGGIVVNKQTGNTLISGHQRLTVMDELQKYDAENPETDYSVRVDMVDVDEKSEKELNILLNNPAAQGYWDFDKLAALIPDIDYKDAGLSEEDLSMIGVDYLFKTEEESQISAELDNLMLPVEEEKERQKQERETIKQAQEQANEQQEQEDKIAHMKDVKEQVKTQAMERAMDNEAYVMLSFDNFESKREFMSRFGYPENLKFIKGEEFDARCEVIEVE